MKGGLYRGIVKSVTDPEDRHRILVTIPSVFNQQRVWAEPCRGVGDVGLPRLEEGVWIMFEEGHVTSPVWIGTWRPMPGCWSGEFLGDHYGSSFGDHQQATISTTQWRNLDATASTSGEVSYSVDGHNH